VNKKQKDVLLSLHHHLTALVPGGGGQVGKLTHVTPHTVEKQVASFKGHTEAIYQCSGLLQVIVICGTRKLIFFIYLLLSILVCVHFLLIYVIY
jgi:hypothetical protein